MSRRRRLVPGGHERNHFCEESMSHQGSVVRRIERENTRSLFSLDFGCLDAGCERIRMNTRSQTALCTLCCCVCNPLHLRAKPWWHLDTFSEAETKSLSCGTTVSALVSRLVNLSTLPFPERVTLTFLCNRGRRASPHYAWCFSNSSVLWSLQLRKRSVHHFAIFYRSQSRRWRGGPAAEMAPASRRGRACRPSRRFYPGWECPWKNDEKIMEKTREQ